MGIPANVTVRLMVDTIAFPVTNSFFQTVVGTVISFLYRCIYRSTISGKSQFFERNKVLVNRSLKEKSIKNISEPHTRLHIGSQGFLGTVEINLRQLLFQQEQPFLPYFLAFAVFLWADGWR